VIRLMHGDSRELLPAECPNPAVIVTDPPYGIGYSSGWTANTMPADGRTHLYGNRWNGSIAGDESTWAFDWLACTYPGVPIAVFGHWSQGAPWPNPRALLVWDKGDSVGMGDLAVPWKPNHEPIWIYGAGWTGPRTSAVLRGPVVSRITMGRTHPHEKSVPVIAEIIDKAPAGTVLDPFAGTGAALLAAAQLGREAVGVEIESVYVETANRRLGQTMLWTGAP
jgi:DNA modification methylase